MNDGFRERVWIAYDPPLPHPYKKQTLEAFFILPKNSLALTKWAKKPSITY